MKRACALFLLIVLIGGLCGCNKTADNDLMKPVIFYYCNNLDSKEDFSNVFVPESHEGADFQDNEIGLLNQYFQGPDSNTLSNPFPANLTVLSVESYGDSVYITLSNQIEKYSGLDLTLACTCLSITLFELYACNSVEITTHNGLLDGREKIIMTKDSMIFTDDSYSISGE